MPSWEGQPTAAPFLLFHNFPGSVCADEPGLPAPGRRGSGAGGSPGTMWSAPLLHGGAVPS